MSREKMAMFAVLTLVVIIIIAIIEPRSPLALCAIAGVIAFGVSVMSSEHRDAGEKDTPSSAAARLAQTGFDKNLLGEPDQHGRATSGGTGSFCPAKQLRGAAIESSVLNVLGGGEGKEGFFPLPGKHPPYAVAASIPQEAPDTRYQGAIEVGDYDVDSAGQPVFTADDSLIDASPEIPAGAFDMAADDAWDRGHRDRLVELYEYSPEGNPFDLSRTSAPKAAPPCIDDEANDDSYDIDERNTYQARSRNDATRVTTGTMNRLKMMDPYLREECEIVEDRMWWGRHEL